MMDLSDGLASDLPRLAAASGLGFEVNLASLPLHPGSSPENGLRDGEDYELLFAVPRDREKTIGNRMAIEIPKIAFNGNRQTCRKR